MLFLRQSGQEIRNIGGLNNSSLQLNACISVFVDSLIKMGLNDVVISPGSRNFPLIHALAERKLNLISVVDERSAAFIGLGMAKGLRKPVALCCTSGTAALNYYPAIAEAYYAQIPLLVLTADRPPESIDNWEGQSIRQREVFKNHILASFETSDDYSNTDSFAHIAHMAMEHALLKSGPVHVNLPFREPFYRNLERTELSNLASPVKAQSNSFQEIPNEFHNVIKSAKQILWLNGAQNAFDNASMCTTIPVFSDVIANAPENVSWWDGVLLANPDLDNAYQPDVLITTGTYMVSKQLRLWLRSKPDLIHWHIGQQKDIPTPFLTTPRTMNSPIKEVCTLVDRINTNTEYLQRWKQLSEAYGARAERLDWDCFTEFSVLNRLNSVLPNNCSIHLANSMSVRYWGYLPKNNTRNVYCNRGTSGIDGCTSTAVGYALTTPENVFLITGDLAFFYDVNGLWLNSLPNNLKIVVLNNYGGGIFKLIEGPSAHNSTLEYQTTPHQRTAKHISTDLGLNYYSVANWEDFDSVISQFMNQKSASVLEVQTDEADNTSFYHSFKEIKI